MTRFASNDFRVRVRVELGKPFSYDFGAGNYVIQRHPDIPNPSRRYGVEYIFAAPGVRGWTTDGTDVIAEGACLHWNGTLQFAEFKETDLGEYNRPLQYEPDPSKGRTLYIFYANDDDNHDDANHSTIGK